MRLMDRFVGEPIHWYSHGVVVDRYFINDFFSMTVLGPLDQLQSRLQVAEISEAIISTRTSPKMSPLQNRGSAERRSRQRTNWPTAFCTFWEHYDITLGVRWFRHFSYLVNLKGCRCCKLLFFLQSCKCSDNFWLRSKKVRAESKFQWNFSRKSWASDGKYRQEIEPFLALQDILHDMGTTAMFAAPRSSEWKIVTPGRCHLYYLIRFAGRFSVVPFTIHLVQMCKDSDRYEKI